MSHVATPADSAGGSNAATADDGHGANPIAANPVAAAALAGPGGAPAQPTPGAALPHHAANHPPPFASNPPPTTHALLHDADGQVWMTANAASTQGAAHQPHPLANPQPAHSMQNSVFTARRWVERATGSTSTVGRGHSAGEGVDKEDSAGDSNTAAVSEGTIGPADSTQAQHVKSGGGSPSRSVGGEEVEGGGSFLSDGGGSFRGGEAVDSHPGFGRNIGGIGDGFAETGRGAGSFGGQGQGGDVQVGSFAFGRLDQGGGLGDIGGLTGDVSFVPGKEGGIDRAGSRRTDRRGVRGGVRRGGNNGGGRSSSGIGMGGTQPTDVPLVAAGAPAGQVQSGPGGSFGAPKPAGSALKGGSVLPPVPLFNAAPPHVRGINSPVPPGTAAAARAAQTQEAEGECDGLTNPGLGGMDIGDGNAPMGYVVPAHSEEHGYAPALASGDMTYSGDGGLGSLSGGGDSGPGSIGGGGGDSGPNSGAPSSGGLGSGGGAGGGAAAPFDSNRLRSGGNQPGPQPQPQPSGGFEFGGFAPNVPAVAAVSGAGPADGSHPFSGPSDGDNPGFPGPADGSGRGFSGGGDVPAAKSQFSNGGLHAGGFVYRDTTAGNQTLQGQHRAVSGSLGHVSMHKNGPTTMARAVVEDGGDDSEEDGEEGVSPAFVPEDGVGEESPTDVDM